MVFKYTMTCYWQQWCIIHVPEPITTNWQINTLFNIAKYHPLYIHVQIIPSHIKAMVVNGLKINMSTRHVHYYFLSITITSLGQTCYYYYVTWADLLLLLLHLVRPAITITSLGQTCYYDYFTWPHLLLLLFHLIGPAITITSLDRTCYYYYYYFTWSDLLLL